MASIPKSTKRPLAGAPPPALRSKQLEPAAAEPRRELDGRQLREERILDVASAQLARWGYRKTTIDDVAREAGVGKGTIYLHWREKNQLFNAAIWRANQVVLDDLIQRIEADPDGGLLHRLWTHGTLAAMANPLMMAIMRGQADLFQGLLDDIDLRERAQLIGDSDAFFGRLQAAGIIRNDLSVSTITYFATAMKVGVIHAADALGGQGVPSIEEIGEGLSDLFRRWLEPEQAPSVTAPGKEAIIAWLKNAQILIQSHLDSNQVQTDSA
jgi:AcrR family transcriptional regulator